MGSQAQIVTREAFSFDFIIIDIGGLGEIKGHPESFTLAFLAFVSSKPVRFMRFGLRLGGTVSGVEAQQIDDLPVTTERGHLPSHWNCRVFRPRYARTAEMWESPEERGWVLMFPQEFQGLKLFELGEPNALPQAPHLHASCWGVLYLQPLPNRYPRTGGKWAPS